MYDFKWFLDSKIMEIGLNSGHSAELFLLNSNAPVYSFDMGVILINGWSMGKNILIRIFQIDSYFGDSRESLPRFKNNNDLNLI